MDQITVGDFPGEAQTWLASHGYQSGHISVHGYSGFGIIYSRVNQPAHMAMPGQTLVWDDVTETVTVQQ